MKRKIMGVVMSAMLTMLTACGGGSQSTGGSDSGASKDSADSGGSKDQVELTWQFWGDENDKAQWQKLADKVTDVYPNIKVKLQIYDWGTYWTKIQTQIASGTIADIVGMQSLQMPVYASKDAMVPLDDYISKTPDLKMDDFNKVIMDGMSYKGKTYALPYDYGAVAIYYNKDMFDKYNVPYPDENMTWDDFVDRAKKLTHPENKEYGFGFNGDLGSAVPFIWQAGGDYLQPDGTYKLDQPETKKAFDFLANLVNVQKVSPPMSDLATNGVGERWQAGNIGMIIDGPWSLINYKKFCKFKFDVAVLPNGPTGKNTSDVAGSGFGISASSKHKEEAFKAISVITSSESLGMLAEAGRAYPARDSAVEKYNKNSGIEHVDAFQKQAENSRAFATTPTWNEVTQAVNQNLQPLFFGKADVDTTIKNIQEKVDAIK